MLAALEIYFFIGFCVTVYTYLQMLKEGTLGSNGILAPILVFFIFITFWPFLIAARWRWKRWTSTQ